MWVKNSLQFCLSHPRVTFLHGRYLCRFITRPKFLCQLNNMETLFTVTPWMLKRLNVTHYYAIPANFFWDISVRFLSWECWFLKTTRSFPKIPEEVLRLPKTSEVCRSLPKASSLPVLFTSKIRDREEGTAIYSFYTWFSFLTWVWVNIFSEIMSSRTATTHIFQSGVRNWPAGVRRREIEVFNPQAWDSRPRRESWQVYYAFVYFWSHLQAKSLFSSDSSQCTIIDPYVS